MASDAPASSSDATPKNLEEQGEIEKALQKEMRKGTPLSAAGCLLRGILVASALMVLISCGGYYSIQAWIAGYAAKRDALIAELRAKGEPLDVEDLAKFTALPDGTNDLTQRYLDIVRNYIGPRNLSAEEELLPIIGKKATMGAVPGAGIPWAEEETARNYFANRPWLKDAEDLADEKGSVGVQRDYTQGLLLSLTDVQGLRELTRDLSLQFEIRMRDGDRRGALRTLRAMFSASRMLQREPLLVSQLVRVACYGISAEYAGQMLRDRKATLEEISSIREMLDNDFREGLIRALKGERAAGLITLTSHNFKHLNDVAEDQGYFNAVPPVPWNSKVADLRPGDTARLLEMLTEEIEVAEASDFPQLINRFQILEDKFKQRADDEKTALPWNRNMLPNLLIPAVQPVRAFARATALESALKATLAVEERLTALPPGQRTKETEIALIQEFLPLDPFTGQPMKYAVDAQGYKIYSVGKDGIDDTARGDSQDNDVGVWIERTLPK